MWRRAALFGIGKIKCSVATRDSTRSQPAARWSHDCRAKPKKSKSFQVRRNLCGSRPGTQLLSSSLMVADFGLFAESLHNRKALRVICSVGVCYLHSSWLSKSLQAEWFLHLSKCLCKAFTFFLWSRCQCSAHFCPALAIRVVILFQCSPLLDFIVAISGTASLHAARPAT